MTERSEPTTQVIRPNQLVGWSAAIVAVAVTVAASAFVDLPWGGSLLRQVFWGAVMLLLLDEIWRYDFRPRMLWNSGGLVVVDRKGAHRHPWAEVRTISVRSNTVFIRTPDGLLKTRFDRLWWLARLCPSIRDLPETIEHRLRAAHDNGLASSSREPPSTPRTGRPLMLYVLAVVGLLAIVAAAIVS
jgi:hypothetical protein